MTYYDVGNREEAEFAAWATSQGWSATKRAWPDFICRRNGEVMCVEVKDRLAISLPSSLCLPPGG